MTDNVVNLPTADAMVEAIARVCHEANRAYSASLGDYSHLPWLDTSRDQRESVKDAVRFLLRNPYCPPEELHARWMKHRLAASWTFGHTKDVTARKHPNLLAWHKLPAHERVKDSLFKSVVDAFRFYETPGPNACLRHGAMFQQTQFLCCLPEGHTGPCAPTHSIDPIEIIRPGEKVANG